MRRPFLLLAPLVALSAISAQAQVPPPVLKVEGGGTGANTAAAARANLGAAASAANSDITSLSGLTTPLPASEGGTGGVGGVSPTGSLSTTPEAVINVADFGGCSGAPATDTANLNAALAAARSSSAYTGNAPVRVTGGYSTTGIACAITQANATGFTRFGGGARLLIEDLALLCSGAGNICLDTLGSLNVQFNKVTLIGSAGSPPMIGLQEGNTAPATVACCIHTHYGLEITGSFSFAGLYSAASESTTYYSPIVRNDGANLGVVGTLGAITGGSGYINGTYSAVALSGSATGHGAIATVVVSGGAVASVDIDQPGQAICDRRHADRRGRRPRRLGRRASMSGSPISASLRWSWTARTTGASPPRFRRSPGPRTLISLSPRTISSAARCAITAAPSKARRFGWPRSKDCARFISTSRNWRPALASRLFDNNATSSLHNIGETLEIECELAAATYDVQVTGSNPTPNISGLNVYDQLSTVNTAILGVDAGITAVTAHGANVNVTHSMFNVPLFGIGAAGLWSLDGAVSLQFPWEYNAPASTLVPGVSGGVPMSGAGPLDFLTSTAGASGAYSCARRLSFAYYGPLCNIRRASDLASIDFYPDFSGVIDKSALGTFCANTSCLIAAEYDQTGNGNTAHNATTTTQPALTIEGPALNYAACGTWGNGGNVSLTVSSNSAINGVFASGGFASAVTNRTATITNSMRLLSKLSGGSGWEISGAYTLGFGFPQFTVDALSTAGAWVSTSLMPSSGGHIFDVAYSYASLSNVPVLGVDGSAATYQSATQPAGSISDLNNLTIGNSAAGGFGWPGDICEVLIARQPLSAAQIDAIRRNQAVFYGISGVL